jgi:hypothetical protein
MPLPSPIALLPADLHRWDRSPGGDALVVPIWTDVRPLRGASGLLDWRLCGRLSQMLREGRFTGTLGEKLLLVSTRVPWKRILAIGVGASDDFGTEAFRSAVECILSALRGIGAASIAIAPPGRDIDAIRADRAMQDLLAVVEEDQQKHGAWLSQLTVIDSASVSKTAAGAGRAASTTGAAGSSGASAR